MIRIIMFMLIAMITLITINHYIDLQEEGIGQYNQRVMTVAYYKKLFDSITNSGLFDNLYDYNGYIVNGTLYTLSNQSIFPLYILTYYDEDSYEYSVAVNYALMGSYQPTDSVYLDYGDGNVVSIDQDYLTYFQEKMSEFQQATGVNMVIYYDVYKVYGGTCQGVYKYSYETVYIDKYGFMHIIKVLFC